tara:strand:- start:1015 stop:1227 length:213 start_codon:yes stop_codon:yes gene_type:complete
MAETETYAYLDEFSDLEQVETRIQLLREDYRALTNRIEHYGNNRSKLELDIRKLKGLAASIKERRANEDI